LNDEASWVGSTRAVATTSSSQPQYSSEPISFASFEIASRDQSGEYLPPSISRPSIPRCRSN
jgi:hypothetical protein